MPGDGGAEIGEFQVGVACEGFGALDGFAKSSQDGGCGALGIDVGAEIKDLCWVEMIGEGKLAKLPAMRGRRRHGLRLSQAKTRPAAARVARTATARVSARARRACAGVGSGRPGLRIGAWCGSPAYVLGPPS